MRGIMKILYMITDLDFGGAETQLMRMVHYVKEYTQDDVQVVSVIKSEYQGFIQELNSIGVPFTSLDLKKNGNYFYAIKKYKKLLKDYQPDVIHTHMIHANLFARVFKNTLPQSLLINTVHGEEDFLGKRALLYRYTDNKADYTTCVSRALEKQMLAAGAVKKEKVLTVYNGLSTSEYCTSSEIRKEYREKLALSEEDFNWMIAGRLSPEKNHKNLLEALKLVNRKNTAWKLLVAGEGNTRPLIEEFLHSNDELKEKVELLGRRSDVASLLNAADGFVLSSNYEGLPLVLQEAAAVGLPMISTNVGGCDEVVMEGVNGYLVPKQNETELAAAMLKLMSVTKEQRLKMGHASKELVEKEFAMDEVMNKWYELYHKKY